MREGRAIFYLRYIQQNYELRENDVIFQFTCIVTKITQELRQLAS